MLIDFLHQFLDAAKRAATNGLLRNAVEPNLHLIQPSAASTSLILVSTVLFDTPCILEQVWRSLVARCCSAPFPAFS